MKKPSNTVLNYLKWLGFRKIYWIFKKIFQNQLTNNDLSQKIINIYDGYKGQNTNINKSFIGFGLIHYSLIRNIRAKNILCIGSRKGFIPVILALACKDNHYGKVYFVDAGYDKNESDKHWSGIGFWKDNDPKKHFDKVGVEKYIDTFVMTSNEYKSKFNTKQYDYIYIDGDHSYKGVKLDYNLFWPKLNKNGFMVFHDVIAKGYLDKGLFGVHRFWNEIKNNHSVVFPFPKDSGLGILQKI